MEIYLKNTLTGNKEIFKPVSKNKVKMYHCGPTVYSRQHLGNISAFIYSDVLKRLFEYQKYKVTEVINITDVGHLTSDADEGTDKVEEAAKKSNLSAKEITQNFTDLFIQDLQKVNIETQDIIFPKATENIPEQISLIQELEKKGFIYKISDGIYFNTSLFPDYGKLGDINLKGLKEGARVKKKGEKKNPTDFALWKFSKPEEKRQQEWPSPWGVGFPGWHLECSAMSKKFLGQTFDIHLGGIEHIPTHHNGEIAQSEAAYDKKLANYWVHLNHLMLKGEKISKSLGNVIYTEDLEKHKIPYYVFRYWLLTSNYDVSSNLTWEALAGARNGLQKLLKFLGVIFEATGISSNVNKEYLQEILEKLNDNLNTPQAVALLWKLTKDKKVSSQDKLGTILEIDKILNIGFLKILENSSKHENRIPEKILELAKIRENARAQKNWSESDILRDQIKKEGYEVLDTPNGFKIHRK